LEQKLLAKKTKKKLEEAAQSGSVDGVAIRQYFGLAPRTFCSSSSLPPEELQQLTQQIRDQLEESIIERVTRQLMASFSRMQS